MVTLILSKYVITYQIAQTGHVYKVMYVTLPISSDWISDIQTFFSDLLLMLQKIILLRKCTAPNTVNLLQASYTMIIKKEKTDTAKKMFKTNKF